MIFLQLILVLRKMEHGQKMVPFSEVLIIIDNFMKTIKSLNDRIQELEETIEYMPGGPVYQEAKEHFEELKKN